MGGKSHHPLPTFRNQIQTMPSPQNAEGSAYILGNEPKLIAVKLCSYRVFLEKERIGQGRGLIATHDEPPASFSIGARKTQKLRVLETVAGQRAYSRQVGIVLAHTRSQCP